MLDWESTSDMKCYQNKHFVWCWFCASKLFITIFSAAFALDIILESYSKKTYIENIHDFLDEKLKPFSQNDS